MPLCEHVPVCVSLCVCTDRGSGCGTRGLLHAGQASITGTHPASLPQPSGVQTVLDTHCEEDCEAGPLGSEDLGCLEGAGISPRLGLH